MRTVNNKKLINAVCVALMLLISSPVAFAYPPDNAAVLYYRACLWYEPNEAMRKAVLDFCKDKIEIDERIKKYVESNLYAINFAVTAADVPDCDWGIDYSEGMSTRIPPLSTFRNIAKLIVADAKILASEGDYESALERCLSVQKMARHISDGVLVSYLVGVSLNNMVNECLQAVLADMPADLKSLNLLKNELGEVAEDESFSFKAAVGHESKLLLVEMEKADVEQVLAMLSDENVTSSSLSEPAIERILTDAEKFFGGNEDYWKRHMASVKAASEMPYAQAYNEIKKLSEKPEKEAIENPDAILTAIFVPALSKVYNIEIRGKTFSNAVRTGIEVYIIKAKTGQLPEVLPAGLPDDLFSGKDFEYERKDGGFVLRCRGKDLLNDKIHQYEFKVRK